jgi:hypothetical protein
LTAFDPELSIFDLIVVLKQAAGRRTGSFFAVFVIGSAVTRAEEKT